MTEKDHKDFKFWICKKGRRRKKKKSLLCFIILQNYDSHLISQETGNYNFKVNVVPTTIKKYMDFTINLPEKKGIKPRLPLLFIDSENNFYHHLSGKSVKFT